jgi:hypothetical protein
MEYFGLGTLFTSNKNYNDDIDKTLTKQLILICCLAVDIPLQIPLNTGDFLQLGRLRVSRPNACIR